MPQVKLQVPDFKQIVKGFEAISDRVQRRVMRSAISAGATEMKKAIRKATPVSRKTGTRDLWSESTKARRAGASKKNPLKQSLVTKPSSKWRNSSQLAAKGIIGASIGHDYSIAPHAHLVEEGHELYAWSSESSGYWVAGTNYFSEGQEQGAAPASSKIKSKARERFEAEVVKAYKKEQKKKNG